jgi:glycosyltransferase involved in cell wall biosynthesis
MAEMSEHDRCGSLRGQDNQGTAAKSGRRVNSYMRPLVSIVINNFNYARFLPDAINSALAQTYAPVEVIVVDDGSIDHSRQVIASYGDKVVAIIKNNGGQSSAFNAGVVQSRGMIICLLDSDDYFAPDKVANVVAAFEDHDFLSKPMMVHHPLWIVGDAASHLSGRIVKRTHDSPLNLYNFARRYHFIHYVTGPTTSLSINRALATYLFPIPEDTIRISADDFIVRGASLVGELYSLDQPCGFYRVHGKNAWFGGNRRKSATFHEVLDRYLNKILIEIGREPVMSFGNSMGNWRELALEQRWLALLAHIVKLAISQHDMLTARFAYRALRLAIQGPSQTEKAGADWF